MAIDQEILSGFKDESNQLLKELGAIIEKFEESGTNVTPELASEFALKIDRIMGASKTLAVMEPTHQGFPRIGKLSEICKTIGYKTAEKKDPALTPFFTAFLADTVEVIEKLIGNIDNAEETAKIVQSFTPVLEKRLQWLAAHLKK